MHYCHYYVVQPSNFMSVLDVCLERSLAFHPKRRIKRRIMGSGRPQIRPNFISLRAYLGLICVARGIRGHSGGQGRPRSLLNAMLEVGHKFLLANRFPLILTPLVLNSPLWYINCFFGTFYTRKVGVSILGEGITCLTSCLLVLPTMST